MARSLDRWAQGWRMTVFIGIVICVFLAVCAATLLLQGMSDAQTAFQRLLASETARWKVEDDPRAFQPYAELAVLVASSAMAAIGAWRLWQWRIEMAVGPSGLAALGFGLGALGMVWSSSILHPCFDDVAFYNCQEYVAGDRIALATLLLAVVTGLCGLSSVPARRLSRYVGTDRE